GPSVVGDSCSRLRMASQQPPTGLTVDDPIQLGDEWFAVLGDHECPAFRELADFSTGQNRYVVRAGVSSTPRSAMPLRPRHSNMANQFGDFLVEGGVLGPAEEAEDVRQPQQCPSSVLAEHAGQLPPGLCCVDE